MKARKIFWVLLALAVPLAAVADQIIRQDNLTLGRPATTVAKSITFDDALGVNNPKMSVAHTTGEMTWNKALISQGNLSTESNLIFSAIDATNANKVIGSYTRATGTSVGVRGVAISASGTATTSSLTFVDVANLSVTITTSGRPVHVGLVGFNEAGGIEVNAVNVVTVIQSGYRILRDSTEIGGGELAKESYTTSNQEELRVPCASIQTIDVVSPGTYTYKFQQRMATAGGETSVRQCKLMAYEL